MVNPLYTIREDKYVIFFINNAKKMMNVIKIYYKGKHQHKRIPANTSEYQRIPANPSEYQRIPANPSEYQRIQANPSEYQ